MSINNVTFPYTCSLCGDEVRKSNAYIQRSVTCRSCCLARLDKLPARLAEELVERISRYWICENCKNPLTDFKYKKYCSPECVKEADRFKSNKRSLSYSLKHYSEKYDLNPDDLCLWDAF